MNLTKERINVLEGYLSAPDIALPSEEKGAMDTAADLIAYWKSQQPKETRNWRTKPISRTCEVNLNGMCGKLTTYAYRAHKMGWMALCEEHGHQHLPYCDSIEELIAAGESFEPYEVKSVTT